MALDIGHGEIAEALDFSHVVDPRDVGVIDAGVDALGEFRS